MEEAYSSEELKGLDKNNRPYRVLVVDDEDGTRMLITRILKSAFYDVCGEAPDGRMGVALYKNLRPDLVTLDVKMPYCNGYQALKEILDFDPDAQVLMLTNEDSSETVLKILRAGAKDYLLKPVSRQKILTKLKKIRPEAILNKSISIEEAEKLDKNLAEMNKKYKKPYSQQNDDDPVIFREGNALPRKTENKEE